MDILASPNAKFAAPSRLPRPRRDKIAMVEGAAASDEANKAGETYGGSSLGVGCYRCPREAESNQEYA